MPRGDHRQDAPDSSPRARYRQFVTGEATALENVDRPTADALWGVRDASEFAAALDAVGDAERTDRANAAALDQESATRVLLRYAPTALVDGCWLVSACAVNRSHDALGATCLDAIHLERGEGDSARHHGQLYRALLASRGTALPRLVELPGVEEMEDADFVLALEGAELGRTTDARVGEVVGFHLAACVLGPPSVVRHACGPGSPGSFIAVHEPTNPVAQRARTLALRALDHVVGTRADGLAQALVGAARFLASRRVWTDASAMSPHAEPHPWAAMRRLVVEKAPHARSFHRNVRLAGDSLESAFDPARFDPDALLRGLAASSFVTVGSPEESRLLTHSVAFGGPMFGVFTEQELAIIRRFIVSLVPPAGSSSLDRSGGARSARGTESPSGKMRGCRPEREPSAWSNSGPSLAAPCAGAGVDPGANLRPAVGGLAPNEVPRPAPLRRPDPPPPARARRSEPPSSRALYHAILTRPDDASTRRNAVNHAHVAYARSARTDGAPDGLIPWSPERFEASVHAHVRSRGTRRAVRLTERILAAIRREDVVYALTQLAPAALVDGAWLGGTLLPDGSDSPVVARLASIYRDELGAGDAHRHHGNVLRRALAGAGVVLGACDSVAFCESRELLDEAFDMPALWLSTALVRDDLFPELLGLNLAIEMAGIGDGYETAARLLRRHGIDPYFFDLHNTIDNAAAGHVAWSIEAVTLHVEDANRAAGRSAANDVARRVARGFSTYAETSAPFNRGVLRAVLGRSARHVLSRVRAGLGTREAG